MGSKKEKIISLRKKGFSYNEITGKLNCSIGTVAYHCKNENLDSNGKYKKNTSEEIEKWQKFYDEGKFVYEVAEKFGVHKATIGKHIILRPNQTFEERKEIEKLRKRKERKELKNKAIEYKGGKCEKCGYCKCSEAMEFHHLNPEEKDFGIGGHTKSWNVIKKELDKCILVCANCHREIHEKLKEDNWS
jgi:transposase